MAPAPARTSPKIRGHYQDKSDRVEETARCTGSGGCLHAQQTACCTGREVVTCDHAMAKLSPADSRCLTELAAAKQALQVELGRERAATAAAVAEMHEVSEAHAEEHAALHLESRLAIAEHAELSAAATTAEKARAELQGQLDAVLRDKVRLPPPSKCSVRDLRSTRSDPLQIALIRACLYGGGACADSTLICGPHQDKSDRVARALTPNHRRHLRNGWSWSGRAGGPRWSSSKPRCKLCRRYWRAPAVRQEVRHNAFRCPFAVLSLSFHGFDRLSPRLCCSGGSPGVRPQSRARAGSARAARAGSPRQSVRSQSPPAPGTTGL